jgi:hypothetical protein
MRKLIVLVGLVMVAVVAFEALDLSDADASSAPPPPPKYNFVLCPSVEPVPATTPCKGTPSADIMVAANGNQIVQGAAGNDIYMGSANGGDKYGDFSTSSDLYGGFWNGQFGSEIIEDRGGLDRVDLSMNSSSYASYDFQFAKVDRDADGAKDDLLMGEINFGGDDKIHVLNHFGGGRIEYIKFRDKTLSGSNLPLTQ